MVNAKIERGKTPEKGRTPLRDTKINNAVRRISVMVYSDSSDMDEFELQNLSIETAEPVIRHFRPEWDLSKVQMKPLTEGYSNLLALFWEDEITPDSIVIRINGPASFGIIDRKREIFYTKLLTASNCIDYVIGEFKNGIVMRYIDGKPIRNAQNLTDEIEVEIARKMANLHRLPARLEWQVGGQRVDRIISSYFTVLSKMLKLDAIDFDNELEALGCPKVAKIVEMVQYNASQWDRLGRVQQTPLVNAHCDCHLDNMMYENVTGNICLIDLEVMRPFPAAFDLAYHFATYETIAADSLQKVNPEKRVVIWLRNYFDELGFDSENMEKVMQDYVTGIKLMLPLVFLNLMLLGILIGQNVPPHQSGFDFASFVSTKYSLVYDIFTGKRLEQLCPGIYIDWDAPNDFEVDTTNRRKSLHVSDNHVAKGLTSAYQRAFCESDKDFVRRQRGSYF